MDDETLVYGGGEIKSLGLSDDGTKARIGGYLVRFGAPDNTDLEGDWFTPETQFGPSMGNGAPALIHHGLHLNPHASPATKSALEWTRTKTLAPLTVERDEVGLFAETVCDMADKREAKIYELVTRGKLKWSSGADTPRVRRRGGQKPGEILNWPIIEGSLTPIPAQHGGTVVAALKAFVEDEGELDAEVEEGLKYSHSQPRDDDGKWTIIAGSAHRISGSTVSADHVRKTAEKHGVSERGTQLLLDAHKEGKVKTDDHLLRAIAHGIHHADGDPHNASHIREGIAKHGVGGSHEGKFGGWEGARPAIEGMRDASEIPTSARLSARPAISGMKELRVAESKLKDKRVALRDKGAAATREEHQALNDEAIHLYGQRNRLEAGKHIVPGAKARKALEEAGFCNAEIDMIAELKKFNEADHPRDANGKFGSGGGGSRPGHGTASGHERIDKAAARHGLNKEATDALHEAHSQGKIVTANHLYRTIVAAHEAAGQYGKNSPEARHINAALSVHGKGGTREEESERHLSNTHGTAEGHKAIDKAAARHGLNKEATEALHQAHDDGHIRTTKQLKRTISLAQDVTGGKATRRTINAAITVHGRGGTRDPSEHSHTNKSFSDWEDDSDDTLEDETISSTTVDEEAKSLDADLWLAQIQNEMMGFDLELLGLSAQSHTA